MADTTLARPGIAPGWSALRGLSLRDVPREFGAALSIVAVAVPVGLAYAALMGAPPQTGLYASIFPMAAYALFGPSRYLIVGPDTATCLLVASAITALGLEGAQEHAVAAAALALIAGLGFGVASLLRLGFLASLLSRPILVGYMGGVALTLLVSQIHSFTGVDIEGPGIIRPFVELARRSGEIHPPVLILAAGLFAALLLLKRFAPRLPGPAIVVVGAIVLSWALDLSQRGVPVIGPIPSGLPAFSLPRVPGRFLDLGLSALGLFFVSFASGILTARSFGARLGVESDANLELRGFAAANIAAGLFQGFAVTGADSRTAVNLAAGGRTPLAPLAAAIILAVLVATLTAPLTLLPQAALGAVLASAALGLIDVAAFVRLARIHRSELVLALVAMGGVIWVGVLQGVFLAIAVTLVHILRLTAWPRQAPLGRLDDRDDLVGFDRHPDARPPDNGVAFLFEAPLLFMNIDHFRAGAQRALDAHPRTAWFALDASAVSLSDSTAIEALISFRDQLESRGVRLVIAGARGSFKDMLTRAGLAGTLGEQGRFFYSVEAAVAVLDHPASGDLR